MTNSFMTASSCLLALVIFGLETTLALDKMIVRHADQLHCRSHIVFVAHDKSHVSFFRRPAMTTRFTFSQNSSLITFCQSNITMAVAMDVHEHCRSNEESVFVNAGVLFFGDTGESENSGPQFLVKFTPLARI